MLPETIECVIAELDSAIHVKTNRYISTQKQQQYHDFKTDDLFCSFSANGLPNQVRQ
jgi:hypothetical protein